MQKALFYSAVTLVIRLRIRRLLRRNYSSCDVSGSNQAARQQDPSKEGARTFTVLLCQHIPFSVDVNTEEELVLQMLPLPRHRS